MIKENDHIYIPLSEWDVMKKRPQLTELIECLEDNLELADAVQKSDGSHLNEWRQFYSENLEIRYSASLKDVKR